MDLQNKVVAITGAGQGLGRAMAVYLAAKGARIAIIDLDQGHMDETKRQVEAAGSNGNTYLCNVANEEQVESTFAAIAADMGGLHGLVNNAGILRDGLMVKVKDGEVSKMSLAQWQSVIDVNLTGVFLCGREAAAKMLELGVEEGVIVNISSLARQGSFGQSNYAAAKTGVVALAEVWAKELARYNIRTGAVAPGTINTDMLAAMKPEARERLIQAVPLQRLGEAEHIARSVAFIFETDYFTGRCIDMDGGLR